REGSGVDLIDRAGQPAFEEPGRLPAAHPAVTGNTCREQVCGVGVDDVQADDARTGGVADALSGHDEDKTRGLEGLAGVAPDLPASHASPSARALSSSSSSAMAWASAASRDCGPTPTLTASWRAAREIQADTETPSRLAASSARWKAFSSSDK